MSGSGAPAFREQRADGISVAIVASSWHEDVMAGLVSAATSTCTKAGASVTVFRVPGTFELPLAAQAAAASGFSAIVALGVVIRGGTPHFEYVCEAATSGLTRVALDTGVPVGFGVLTCDDEAQALARAGLPDSIEDKGAEAAQAAIGMARLVCEIRAARGPKPMGFGIN